jgi:phage terminase small subunit
MSVARLAGHIAQQVNDEDMLKRSGTLIKSPNNERQFIRNPLLDAVSTRQAIINQLSRQMGVSLPTYDPSTLANSAKVSNQMNKNDSAFSLLAKPN